MAVSAQQATFSAYAVAGHDGSTYVVLNNKDPNNSVAATIEFTQPVSSATAMFLTAPSLTSATGISLGGESIGADGSWTGAQSTPLSVNGVIGQLVVPSNFFVLFRTAPSVAALTLAATQLRASATGVSLAKNGMCMDVAQGSRSVGPYIQQHACNGSPNQSFVFASTTDNYYTIRSENNQLCLQAPPSGGSVIQNKCTAGTAQRWQLKRNSDGTYSLATSDGSGCLGVPNCSRCFRFFVRGVALRCRSRTKAEIHEYPRRSGSSEPAVSISRQSRGLCSELRAPEDEPKRIVLAGKHGHTLKVPMEW